MSGPDFLEYHSPCRTFSLAFSSTSGSTSTTSYTSTPSRSTYAQTSLAPFPSDLKLCVASYLETTSDNNITIVGLTPQIINDPEGYAYNAFNRKNELNSMHSTSSSNPSTSSASTGDFVPLAKAKALYPSTKVDFSPLNLTNKLSSGGGSSGGGEVVEMVASTSDCLRLYKLSGPANTMDYFQSTPTAYVGRQASRSAHSFLEQSVLTNAKPNYTAPLTSFDWSTIDPSRIVTSSIDTTCTIWDVSTNTAVTQLISHDREVFDVAWSPASKDIFASVGADGSVRSFDLRQLDHSTILYESTPNTGPSAGATPRSSDRSGRGSPLLRLAFNPNDANSVACIHSDSPVVTILDVRHPGIAVSELNSHRAPVNGIAWCGSGGGSASHSHTASNGYAGGSDYYGEYSNGVSNSMLSSVADDGQVLIWDTARPNQAAGANTSSSTDSSTSSSSGSSHLTGRNEAQRHHQQPQTLPRTIALPNLAHQAGDEVNAVAWGGGRDYLAVGLGGSTVRCLRI